MLHPLKRSDLIAWNSSWRTLTGGGGGQLGGAQARGGGQLGATDYVFYHPQPIHEATVSHLAPAALPMARPPAQQLLSPGGAPDLARTWSSRAQYLNGIFQRRRPNPSPTSGARAAAASRRRRAATAAAGSAAGARWVSRRATALLCGRARGRAHTWTCPCSPAAGPPPSPGPPLLCSHGGPLHPSPARRRCPRPRDIQRYMYDHSTHINAHTHSVNLLEPVGLGSIMEFL